MTSRKWFVPILGLMAGGCAMQVEEEWMEGVCGASTCRTQCAGAGYDWGRCNAGLCLCWSDPPAGDDAGTDAGPEAEADAGDAVDARTDDDGDARTDFDDGGGIDAVTALSCVGFYDCAETCFDEICLESCLRRLCSSAEIALWELNDCIESRCLEACDETTGDPESCNECAYRWCAGEIDACMMSEC